MSQPSDLELVLRSRQGNKVAFGQLVSRYQPMVQRLAQRVTGDLDLAEEIVQDAMLQAYLSLNKLNDPKRFRSWLYGIVLNLCRNYLRRRRVSCFSLEAAIAEGSSDPQLLIEKDELRADLLKAVDSLSPKNRSAILLFYQEECSLQEVAHRLNISVSAVKGRLYKSRQQLKEQLSLVEDQAKPNSVKEMQAMAIDTADQIKPELELCCSFCRKSRDRVNLLIAGPPILGEIPLYICNECVDICNQIIAGSIAPLTQEQSEKLMDSGRL